MAYYANFGPACGPLLSAPDTSPSGSCRTAEPARRSGRRWRPGRTGRTRGLALTIGDIELPLEYARDRPRVPARGTVRVAAGSAVVGDDVQGSWTVRAISPGPLRPATALEPEPAARAGLGRLRPDGSVSPESPRFTVTTTLPICWFDSR